MLVLGNADREGGPSPLIRPWPVGVPVEDVLLRIWLGDKADLARTATRTNGLPVVSVVWAWPQ